MSAKPFDPATTPGHTDMMVTPESLDAWLELNPLPPDPYADRMTPKQYADAIDRLGLSQRAAGRFLGVGERTSRRWISGDSAIPESVAKLLRLMIAQKISPGDVK